MTRYIGVDLGDARIGIAISDPHRILATPMETLHIDQGDRTPERSAGLLAEALASYVPEYEISAVFIGLPRHMGGTEGHSATKYREIATVLNSRIQQPVYLVDERLSTRRAYQQLHASGRRTKGSKGIIDQIAAVEILQGVLDGPDIKHYEELVK